MMAIVLVPEAGVTGACTGRAADCATSAVPMAIDMTMFTTRSPLSVVRERRKKEAVRHGSDSGEAHTRAKCQNRSHEYQRRAAERADCKANIARHHSNFGVRTSAFELRSAF